jgi:hypothetical protein
MVVHGLAALRQSQHGRQCHFLLDRQEHARSNWWILDVFFCLGDKERRGHINDYSLFMTPSSKSDPRIVAAIGNFTIWRSGLIHHALVVISHKNEHHDGDSIYQIRCPLSSHYDKLLRLSRRLCTTSPQPTFASAGRWPPADTVHSRCYLHITTS